MCAREISHPKYEVEGKLERFNEADNAQARGELLPGSCLWKQYYQKYPELEELGRTWSKLPGPGTPLKIKQNYDFLFKLRFPVYHRQESKLIKKWYKSY
jgi:hypothetical protein